jgi:heme oxygenase
MRDVLEPLWRVPAYEADLQFYLGPNWREQLVTSPAIEVCGAGRRSTT